MTEQVEKAQWAPDTDFDEVPVSLLDISNRALNVFRANGIKTYSQLLALEEKDLTDMRGFGQGCLGEVVKALASESLKLKDPNYAARR